MKFAFLPLTLSLLGQMAPAEPLRLHNRIVFTRGELYKGTETVWTMNSNGGDQKRVWRVTKGYGQFGGFSRDGNWALSFNRFNLYVHDLSTRRIRRVLVWSTGWGTYVASPSFSPDAKQIVCEVGDGNQNVSNSQVLVLKTVGDYSFFGKAKPQELHPQGESVPSTNLWSEPRWSANGQKLVVLGGPSYSFNDFYSRSRPDIAPDVWVMNADGTKAQHITKSSSWETRPCWSPDGQKIVFVRQVDTGDYDIGGYATNLWSADVVSGTEKQLTFLPETHDERLVRGEINVALPLFSPNGKQFAFEEETNGGDAIGIYRADADGKNQKRLSDGQLAQWVP